MGGWLDEEGSEGKDVARTKKKKVMTAVAALTEDFPDGW